MTCFKDAIKFISKIYLEILFNNQIIKNYNYYAIENLRLDIEFLDSYFTNISLTHPGFEECLIPIKQILAIFYTKKIDQFIINNAKVDPYYEVKIDQLLKFMLKYKNFKKSSEQKGKITESEMNSLAKKLKDAKG
jgi:hypothetical protein